MRRVLQIVVCAVLPSALVLSALSACSHDKPPETGGYQQGQVQYGQYGGYAGQPAMAVAGAGGQGFGAPTGYGQVPVGAGGLSGGAPATLPSGSGGTSTTPAPAGSTAQIIDPGAAAVIQPIIKELGKQYTIAGAKPVGSPLVANFQTGQVLEGQIQLQPQKCYTIVASGLPPITELNVQLVLATPLPNLTPVLAVDSDTGPTAVVGKKPNCYTWQFPVPTPAKVVAQVTGGSGLAAIQVYEK